VVVVVVVVKLARKPRDVRDVTKMEAVPAPEMLQDTGNNLKIGKRAENA